MRLPLGFCQGISKQAGNRNDLDLSTVKCSNLAQDEVLR